MIGESKMEKVAYNNKGLMKGGSTELSYREHKEGKVMFDDSGYYTGNGNPAEAAARQVGKSAHDTQVGGAHYKDKKCEVWTIIDEYGLDYYRGNALKYILRNKMDTYEDIEKAQHYLEKWLEDNKEIK